MWCRDGVLRQRETGRKGTHPQPRKEGSRQNGFGFPFAVEQQWKREGGWRRGRETLVYKKPGCNNALLGDVLDKAFSKENSTLKGKSTGFIVLVRVPFSIA